MHPNDLLITYGTWMKFCEAPLSNLILKTLTEFSLCFQNVQSSVAMAQLSVDDFTLTGLKRLRSGMGEKELMVLGQSNLSVREDALL
uniref:Uncharacterized protein n=1 Tax=Daphnia galeata TaxID=27404 RepID=A0A8J2RWH5_9CRUS|nr:unnamed protein product [Daphnia galeata]